MPESSAACAGYHPSMPTLRGALHRITTPFVRGGEKAIRRNGHRGYVGGSWDEFGQLQLDFMVSQGLEPHHVLVDVACGSLRAGVHFIPYLDPGNYLGIEKERLLVERGIELELPPDVYEQKRPELLVSSAFEFDRFSKSPEFGIANSLFTHLTPDVIETCLGQPARRRDLVPLLRLVQAGRRTGPQSVALGRLSRVQLHGRPDGRVRTPNRLGSQLRRGLGPSPRPHDDGIPGALKNHSVAVEQLPSMTCGAEMLAHPGGLVCG